MDVIKKLSEELKISYSQVENTVDLLDKDNTVPFIARYRKEVTGGLDDATLRHLEERLKYLRNLKARQEEVTRLIHEQGKLTKELQEKIEKAATLQEVEDIYRPFRPKRKTRATKAKEKGLEPLALKIYKQEDFNMEEEISKYINPEKGVETPEEALSGASDIIAEWISDNPEIRKMVRSITSEGKIMTKKTRDEISPFEMYYEFSQEIKNLPSHRILAINRGENEGYLSVKLQTDEEEILRKIYKKLFKDGLHQNFLQSTIEDSYKRLIAPAVEREIRNSLTEEAERKAIEVFGTNLKNLMLQPPIKGKVVLGFDPAYRTGCKLAVVDEHGTLLGTGVIYPTPPQNQMENSRKELIRLIEKHGITLISLGNGTASREAEKFIADTIKEIAFKVEYIIVNEAGASVYSASEIAQAEFPDLDVSLRGAVSIARRAQDQMAELVKIDPKSIGVGQYQHDVDQKLLKEKLEKVIEDVVNSVGVDLNVASRALLGYISGITKKVAENIVKYREENKGIKSREELKKVKGLGPKAFEQCAGFLRIPESEQILDNTGVHPESYHIAERLLNEVGWKGIFKPLNIVKLAQEYDVGVPTLNDIVKELRKPGRDPREELQKPLLREDVLEIEDLKEGMTLQGVVRNVCDFGAFVDIGVHQDGLIHISQLSDRFIRDPHEVVAVGDILQVEVLNVDTTRNRISLKRLQ